MSQSEAQTMGRELIEGQMSDLDGDYVVYTFYCHGGVLTETCGSGGHATKAYFRRILSGIKNVNQESSPLQKPFHVALVAMVIRDRKTHTIKHDIYSDHFPCEHEAISAEEITTEAKEILHKN